MLAGDKTTVAGDGAPRRDRRNASAGYEIHLGRTAGPDCARPVVDLDGRLDGATSPDGLVAGTYVHGLFADDGFRRAFLAAAGWRSSLQYDATVEATLDGLADHLERHVDIDRLLEIAGYRPDDDRRRPPTSARNSALAAR